MAAHEIVRRAGRRDLDAILELWTLLREHEAKSDSRLALAANASRLAREHLEVILADPNTGLFVAEAQGNVVGFLHAQVEAANPVYSTDRHGSIVDLFVSGSERGQGLGTRLIDYCLEWLRSLNLAEMRVATPVANAGARRLFERAGAHPLTVVQVAWLRDDTT